MAKLAAGKRLSAMFLALRDRSCETSKDPKTFFSNVCTGCSPNGRRAGARVTREIFEGVVTGSVSAR